MSELSPREASQIKACTEILVQVLTAVREGNPADRTLSEIFKANRKYGSRDRRLISEIVFSYLRWMGWLEKLDINAGMAAAHALDTREINPILASLTEAPIEALGEKSIADKLSALQAWFPELSELGVDALIPEEYKALLPKIEGGVEQWVESFQSRPPVVIRMYKGKQDAFLKACKDKGIHCKRGLPLRHAAIIGTPREATELRQAMPDAFEIQNLASQAVAWVCSPAPIHKWWDACCGSGGKTFHLAEFSGDDTRIWATDRRRNALNELHSRMRKNGYQKVRTKQVDILRDETPVESFNGVLLDAPCSGLGNWARNPDARWRTPVKDVAKHARRQLALLAKCSLAVKPGGQMVYSVCTVTREETFDVIAAFLAAHPDFSLVSVKNPITGKVCEGQTLIYPWEAQGDAMFIARLEKKK